MLCLHESTFPRASFPLDLANNERAVSFLSSSGVFNLSDSWSFIFIILSCWYHHCWLCWSDGLRATSFLLIFPLSHDINGLELCFLLNSSKISFQIGSIKVLWWIGRWGLIDELLKKRSVYFSSRIFRLIAFLIIIKHKNICDRCSLIQIWGDSFGCDRGCKQLMWYSLFQVTFINMFLSLSTWTLVCDF